MDTATTHLVKVRRAQRLAPCLPMAEREIWDSVPDALIKRLTGAELGLVVQALNAHWHKAVAHTERNICAEGYVWDNTLKCLRDITLPIGGLNG